MKDSTAVGAVFNRDFLTCVAVENRSHRSFMAARPTLRYRVFIGNCKACLATSTWTDRLNV